MTPGSALQCVKLYEGNFAEWRCSIRRCLRDDGLDTFDEQHLMDHSQPFGTGWDKARASDLITKHISASVLDRIDADEQRDVAMLWKRLQAVAQPFKLLELPAEMRNFIYELTMSGVRAQTVISASTSSPAITRASQQLRKESLPLYHDAVQQYSVYFDVWTRNPYPCVARLTKRASSVPRQRMANLKSIYFDLDVSEQSAIGGHYNPNGNVVEETLRVTFDNEEGLDIAVPNNFTKESKEILAAHLRLAETNRKVLGLEGGHAILYFLMMDPRVWEWRRLQLESSP